MNSTYQQNGRNDNERMCTTRDFNRVYRTIVVTDLMMIEEKRDNEKESKQEYGSLNEFVKKLRRFCKKIDREEQKLKGYFDNEQQSYTNQEG